MGVASAFPPVPRQLADTASLQSSPEGAQERREDCDCEPAGGQPWTHEGGEACTVHDAPLEDPPMRLAFAVGARVNDCRLDALMVVYGSTTQTGNAQLHGVLLPSVGTLTLSALPSIKDQRMRQHVSVPCFLPFAVLATPLLPSCCLLPLVILHYNMQRTPKDKKAALVIAGRTDEVC